MIVPPVALHVTATLVVVLSLSRPTALNCCVSPAATVAVAGETSIRVSVGAGTGIVTTLVSARVPPCCTAITRYVPAALPAVYQPVLVTVPPVAAYVTATLVVELSLIRPTALNCCVFPPASVTLAGLSSIAVSVTPGGGVAIVTWAVSALISPMRTAMTRNVPAVFPAV